MSFGPLSQNFRVAKPFIMAFAVGKTNREKRIFASNPATRPTSPFSLNKHSKIDVVMWSWNAGENFSRVLDRIDQVFPVEVVHQKILVDDHSKDDTRKTAKEYNWQVHLNPSTGISSGANYALSKVEHPFFASVEQDVLLNKEWWPKILRHMQDKKVAVAQGIRLSSEPTLRKLDEYKYTRLEPSKPRQFGVSIDNNLYRTKIIRALGGFPSECPTCTDTILMKKMLTETAFKWIIDASVISEHLRSSILSEARHSYRLTKLCALTEYCVESKNPTWKVLRIFLTSPLRSSIVAYKKRSLKMLYVYPLIRGYKLKAVLEKSLEGFLQHGKRS